MLSDLAGQPERACGLKPEPFARIGDFSRDGEMDILLYLVSADSCPHRLYERKKIATFQGNEWVKPSWSVWPWDVAGNPKHWSRVSQMQRHVRGPLSGFAGGSDGKKSI